MKKLLCVLLIAALLAGFSGTGFADLIFYMEPDEKNKVTVVKPDGIEISEGEVIPYGTVCYVVYFNYPQSRRYTRGDENNVIIQYGDTECKVPIDYVDGDCIREYKDSVEEYFRSHPFYEEEKKLENYLLSIHIGFVKAISAVGDFFFSIFDRIGSFFTA